ncbi:MAG: hypothetical protein IM571_09120 [Chitinophagaceae bacterium]|nr:hypothetical protein [Chitinophagaceae bacterium]
MNSQKTYNNRIVEVLISIVFIFAISSPTVNYLLSDYPIGKASLQIFVAIILILLFSFYRLTKKGYLILQLSTILAIATFSPMTIVKNVCFFYFIFLFSNNYKAVFQRVAIIFFLINAIFIICQLIGVHEIFYYLQDYSNEADATLGEFSFASAMDTQFNYLPQIRPSGFFPAPTYISNFCIFFWYYVLMDKDYQNKILFFLFGFVLMLLGSTLAVFLLLISIFLIGYKNGILIFLFGGICGLLFYLYYFPLTFSYNFNVEEFVESFLVRIISNGMNEESMLVSNPLLFFVLLIVLFTIPLFLQKAGSLSVLFKAAIVVVMPVMIHEAFSSIQFWVTVSFFATEVLQKENFHLARFKGVEYRQVQKLNK